MSNYTYTLLYDVNLKIITDYFTVKNRAISGLQNGLSNGDFLSSDKQYRSAMIERQTLMIFKSLCSSPYL